jgi:hypothetical protein
MVQANTGNQIVDRSIGVVKLDVPTYEAIEHDPAATQQAAIVVGIVALASAIGGAGEGFGGIIVGLLGAFIGWFVFAGITYFVGTNLFGTPTTNTTFEAVLRTMGYAQVPNIVAVVGFIPVLGPLVGFVGAIWSIVTAVIAIRQSLNISTGRAIITGIVAAIISGIILGILALIFSVPFMY